MSKVKIDWKSFKKKYERPKKGQFPTGTRVYKGFQGSGKTLTMIHDIFECRKIFPKCQIWSNVRLKNLEYYYITDTKGLKKAIESQNGEDGVLIAIDEAHLFFNKKDGISLDVLTCISQQRKDRRKIFFTSQIWEELDVSLRKQVKEVVSCKKISKFQINNIIDGESITFDKKLGTWTGQTKEWQIFKHNKELYQAYDTFQKIINNQEYSRENTNNQPIIMNNNIINRRRKTILK